MPGNFGESFVKLRYTAGAADTNNGKPTLAVADYWCAFSDFGRADEDQDLGAAGVVLLPERGNLIGGGKDGILYNLDKNNLGKDTWTPQFNLPFVATYPPNAPNGAAGLPTATVTESELANRQPRSKSAGTDAGGQEPPHPRNTGVHGASDRWNPVPLG